MIPVTKPFLPPKDKYDTLVKGVWDRNWLTNNGPLINQLELKLKDYLGVQHFLVVLNGTIALQLTIKALGLTGKFITTPFSYIATLSSGVWEGLEPVFADIDPQTLNIDPDKVEDKVDNEVSCILATHVFGNPCDVERLEAIGKKHGIKVIYDAAHAFGVTYKEKGLLSYGDVSTLSMHATKLYHMVEGGGVATNDPEIIKSIAFSRNFGHHGETFEGVGINGKNSELHAAMGLANYPFINEIISKRKNLSEHYDKLFSSFGMQRRGQEILGEVNYNYAYYPLILDSEIQTLKVMKELNENNVFPRRYFFPSLDQVPYVKTEDVPVAHDISSRILCLPLYHQLTEEEQEYIVRMIIRAVKY